MSQDIVVGVLALQGAFVEHLHLLHRAVQQIDSKQTSWTFQQVRTPAELRKCDALIIPGGESTTISLVAAETGLLELLREFVKVQRNPTWGTCAGLILLAESANRTKKGGQELIGGLDVRVNRNHFGRQIESFEAPLRLPFLTPEPPKLGATVDGEELAFAPFTGVFIRAPVVERILPVVRGEQTSEVNLEDTVTAPPKAWAASHSPLDHVEIMATLPGRSKIAKGVHRGAEQEDHVSDIVAVRQGNIFGTSFHPELTNDPRIHVWWLNEVERMMNDRIRSDR